MEKVNLTPCSYKALNAVSYDTLASYVATSGLSASFFPKILTIMVMPEEGDEETFEAVGKLIDDKGLDFHISLITMCEDCLDELVGDEVANACVLHRLAAKFLAKSRAEAEESKKLLSRLEQCESYLEACEANLIETRKDKDTYCKWWKEQNDKRVRLEKTIKALRTLLDAVVG